MIKSSPGVHPELILRVDPILDSTVVPRVNPTNINELGSSPSSLMFVYAIQYNIGNNNIV